MPNKLSLDSGLQKVPLCIQTITLSSFEISEQVQMPITQYCNFSADLARPRQRSVRVNGLATCLRLEEVYWTIIEKLAREESLTVGKLISRWALEMDLAHEDVWNFTGYVRVICVVQLMKRSGSMPVDGVASSAGLANARDVQ
jgi:predicted DNA-binding ribbon-helix-helix protein